MTISAAALDKLLAEISELKNTVNSAYDERNMVVLLIANYMNDVMESRGLEPNCGWYTDQNAHDSFKRVISIAHGTYTFHVPDSMDLGRLPIIKPNWDGHTTQEKFERIRRYCSND